MNFQDAEKAYRELKQQYAAGKLTEEQLEEHVGNLLLQDDHGHWWQIGVESGDWYMHDGENWNKAQPPMPPAPATPTPPALATPPAPPAPVTPAAPTPVAQAVPPAPAKPVESPPAQTMPTPVPVASVAPPQVSSAKPVEPAPPAVPVKPVATPPTTPASPTQAPAPIASAAAAPAPSMRAMSPSDLAAHVHKTESKGLPTSTKIGIIAFAAVVLLFIVGGCFLINAALGGSFVARATTTPTRLVALLPIATSTPLDTPLPPTIEIAATETPTLPKPTATRRPVTATPAGPTPTATLNIPPGVYVTNIETNPSIVNVGDTKIGFKVSFLNTTGSVQTYNWLVKVYRCPEQCEDFKHSHGDTLTINSNLPPGTSTFSTSQNVDVKAGISCDLIAIADYIDPVNQFPTSFQSTKNDGHFGFTPCH